MKDRMSRQSFLGENAEELIELVQIGVIGLGGGGSQISQSSAHIGIQRPTAFDPDRVDKEGTNLNRLVGGTVHDAESERLKTEVAERLYKGLQPLANAQFIPDRWQEHAELLRGCHIVFGCVDSYAQRAELETFCRRFLIAYIDIGMDVLGGDKPVIGGQVILSLPGGPCMRCMGFITDQRLAEEGRRYGDVGGRAQVVWPNAVLAGTAVGLGMELLTDWTRRPCRTFDYIVYDGNRMTLQPHLQHEEFSEMTCTHYRPEEVGRPKALLL